MDGKDGSFGWERENLSRLMMRGVMTPFMYRVFEGRRKKWEGAKEAIFHANEHANIYSS